jgi:two-component system nitrate/nitrite sensor histidine kinase NarX
VQVLHVLQESLSNVRKHAGAAHIQLDVFKGARWRFRVRDDGVGFDVMNAPDASHVGLKIMRERAALIGARVEVNSEPGEGTSVTLTLPSHPVAASPTITPVKERDAS